MLAHQCAASGCSHTCARAHGPNGVRVGCERGRRAGAQGSAAHKPVRPPLRCAQLVLGSGTKRLHYGWACWGLNRREQPALGGDPSCASCVPAAGWAKLAAGDPPHPERPSAAPTTLMCKHKQATSLLTYQPSAQRALLSGLV